MKIACLDFETANYSRISACAVSVALFQEGRLMESPYWLVKPPQDHDDFLPEWTKEIHGLSRFDVQHEPEFPGIAASLMQRLSAADIVVAHNAAFDMSVLRSTLEHFDLAAPAFSYLCTCQLARRVWPGLPDHRLNTVAAHIGHAFQHHHAQADAETAGRVLLAMMAHQNTRTPQELLQKLGLEPQRFDDRSTARPGCGVCCGQPARNHHDPDNKIDQVPI